METRSVQNRQQLILLGTLFALSIADALITRYIVAEGIGAETNPLLQPVVLEADFYWIKILGSLTAALILWHLYTRHNRKVIILTAFFVTIYLLIVSWNVGVVLLGSN
jgi:hypothetical protein